jgi:phosphoribosylformylglycinamidine synthase
MHSVAVTEGDWVQGPNDGTAVVVQTQSSASGLLEGQQQMVATSVGAKSRASGGGNPWRAWMAVDEALRNLVCTGAQVGAEDSVCALSVQWKGESPERHPDSAQELVETLEAIKDASLSLGIPVLTSAASFSSKPMMGSLVCHAIGRLRAVRWARSADFKGPGDAVYLLGPESVSLVGSLFAELFGLADDKAVTMPQWSMSRRLYGWLGGVQGKEQGRVRSLHDVSDGGLLVAIAEGLMARNLGISLRMPDGVFPEAWAFGEGFHRLVLSCSEADSAILESEWEALAIPYRRLGSVTASARMELQGHWSVPVGDLRKAWRAEEEWR